MRLRFTFIAVAALSVIGTVHAQERPRPTIRPGILLVKTPRIVTSSSLMMERRAILREASTTRRRAIQLGGRRPSPPGESPFLTGLKNLTPVGEVPDPIPQVSPAAVSFGDAWDGDNLHAVIHIVSAEAAHLEATIDGGPFSITKLTRTTGELGLKKLNFANDGDNAPTFGFAPIAPTVIQNAPFGTDVKTGNQIDIEVTFSPKLGANQGVGPCNGILTVTGAGSKISVPLSGAFQGIHLNPYAILQDNYQYLCVAKVTDSLSIVWMSLAVTNPDTVKRFVSFGINPGVEVLAPGSSTSAKNIVLQPGETQDLKVKVLVDANKLPLTSSTLQAPIKYMVGEDWHIVTAVVQLDWAVALWDLNGSDAVSDYKSQFALWPTGDYLFQSKFRCQAPGAFDVNFAFNSIGAPIGQKINWSSPSGSYKTASDVGHRDDFPAQLPQVFASGNLTKG